MFARILLSAMELDFVIREFVSRQLPHLDQTVQIRLNAQLIHFAQVVNVHKVCQTIPIVQIILKFAHLEQYVPSIKMVLMHLEILF